MKKTLNLVRKQSEIKASPQKKALNLVKKAPEIRKKQRGSKYV